MTGGSPRLVMILYELIAKDNILDAKLQFQKLLDQISPFYQDRIRDLGPQERALLETLALTRDQLKTPALIAKKMRKSQRQTSSLLKRMLKAGYLSVGPHPQDRRSNIYVIKEGLFDLWLSMSQLRRQRKYLPYLVEFFEKWYRQKREREQKRQELNHQLESIKQGTSPHENTKELLCYLSQIGESKEKFQAKAELLPGFIDMGDFKITDSLVEDIKQLNKLPLHYQWMTQQFEGWQSEPVVDLQQQVEDMIACWSTQRSGNLEKMMQIAVRLDLDLSGRGLHKINISFLQETLEQVSPLDERYEILRRISDSQMEVGEMQQALQTATITYHYACILKNITKQIISLELTGTIYLKLKQYEKSKHLFLQVLGLSRKLEDLNAQASTYHKLGIIEQEHRQWPQAKGYYQKALKIQLQLKDPSAQASTYHKLGIIAQENRQWSQAKGYHQKALKIQIQFKELNAQASTYHNLGMVAQEQRQWAQAMGYYQKALKIQVQLENLNGQASIYHTLGMLVQEQRQWSQAEAYYQKALKIKIQFKDRYAQAGPYLNLGTIA